MSKSIAVELQFSGSDSVHRVVCTVYPREQVLWEYCKSLVDGDWVQMDDTTRGAIVFHTRTVDAFAVLGAQRNARVVRVTL